MATTTKKPRANAAATKPVKVEAEVVDNEFVITLEMIEAANRIKRFIGAADHFMSAAVANRNQPDRILELEPVFDRMEDAWQEWRRGVAAQVALEQEG